MFSVTSYSGVSIGIESVFPTSIFSGVSLGVEYDLCVEVYDSDTNEQLFVPIQVSNSTYPLDEFTNGESDGTFGHRLIVDLDSNLTFDLNVVGYVPKTEGFSYIDNGETQKLIIFLDPSPNAQFSCTTTPKNSSDQTVTRILKQGYLEVVFTSNVPFDFNDYTASFEAFVGGNKFSGIALNSELFNTTANTVTYHVEVLDSDFDVCYLSNFIKNQC